MHLTLPADLTSAPQILDAYFRALPSGTRLRFERRDDTRPGRTLTTWGVYVKSDRSLFALVAGEPMVGDELTTWPDHIARDAGILSGAVTFRTVERVRVSA